MAKVEKDANDKGCWFWRGTVTPAGQVLLGISSLDGGGMVTAKKFSYETAFGPVEKNTTIQAVCEEPLCVRPDHLEALPKAEKPKPGGPPNREKTHCPKGHPYDEANTYRYRGARSCRRCRGLRVLQ